jgi:CelD/BcsL family acetyltransferase involved in cellulose biosynthesis
VLYAGDTIAALDFGLRSRHVLYPWLPTYNVLLAKYSPGFLYWIETMKAANALGINHLDLGTGGEPYKNRFMSGATKVAEGTVDLRPAMARARRVWWTSRERIRASPLSRPALASARFVRRVQCWLSV